MTTATATHDTHTPLWAVVVLGLLLLPLAALGFALSFQMMLPVMIIAGWSVTIAWGGPVLVDIAAASGALMQMVSRDRNTRAWGSGVLVFSTLLSIAMNLAGHSIKRPAGALPSKYAGLTLPDEWKWVVILMSIATPLFIAVLVHAFGHILMAYLNSRSIPADSTTKPTIGPTTSVTTPTKDRPSTPAPSPSRSTLDPAPEQQESAPIGPGRDNHLIDDPTSTQPRSNAPEANSIQPRPTRPDRSDRPNTRSIEELIEATKEMIDRGELDPQPSAESIRKALSIAPARAREIRDRVRPDRPLRVVGIDA